MIYFPSEFINALSAYDDRLTPHGAESAEKLLIEEHDVPLLKFSEHKSLVILTADKDKCARADTEHRYVYKYQQAERLIAEIFEEPHEIRHFLILGLDECPDELSFDSFFVDVLHCQIFSDSIIANDRFLNTGTHYLYSGVLDLLDPPAERIMEIIEEQSKIDAVDIVSVGIYGALTDALMKKSDLNYILATEKYAGMANDLSRYFSGSTIVKLPIDREAAALIKNRRSI